MERKYTVKIALVYKVFLCLNQDTFPLTNNISIKSEFLPFIKAFLKIHELMYFRNVNEYRDFYCENVTFYFIFLFGNATTNAS